MDNGLVYVIARSHLARSSVRTDLFIMRRNIVIYKRLAGPTRLSHLISNVNKLSCRDEIPGKTYYYDASESGTKCTESLHSHALRLHTSVSIVQKVMMILLKLFILNVFP